MAYSVKYTNAFKKRYKLLVRRGYNIAKLRRAVEILVTEGALPTSYKPHKLVGNRAKQWECHIEPDWLLIYRKEDTTHIQLLLLVRTGTHAKLFGM